MDIRIVSVTDTRSSADIISLDEVKNYLRITNTQDDAEIQDMIDNSITACERHLKSDILGKQRELYLREINDGINLPYAPLESVDSITINGEAITEGSGYEVNGIENPLIEISTGVFAFSRGGQRSIISSDKVLITYTTSGIGALEYVKQGIKSRCAMLYYGRTAQMSTNWKAYLSPFRIFGYYGTT